MDKDILLSDYLAMYHRKVIKLEYFSDGLTKSELIPLMNLRRYELTYPECEGIYVSELADKLCITSPAVSKMTRLLENKGLVERHVDRNDRRNTFICLTAKGRDECEAIFSRLAEFHERIFDEVGREEVRKMLDINKKIIDMSIREMKKMENKGGL